MAKSGDGRRVAMMEKEVQQVVARFIQREMKDDLPGLVSVSRVQVPTDLRAAKVFVTVLALGGVTEADRAETEAKLRKDAVKILQSWAGEIQAQIDSELNLRFVPKLTFVADDTIEKVLKVDGLLRDLSQKKNPTE